MKLLITSLTVCALALVASVRAQDDNPNKKKHGGEGQGQNQAAQVAPKQHQGKNAGGGQGAGQGGGKHKGASNQPLTHSSAPLNDNSGANANNGGKNHKNKGNKQNANAAQEGNNAKGNQALPIKNNDKLNKTDKKLAKQEKKNSPEFQAKKAKAQEIHQQHLNFKAQANQSIPSVKFNKNYKIQNAQNWKGNQYIVFKNYHPQWHDQGWWHNHYHDHVFLFAGGWYYWNSGYYYPAWGYSDSEAYYPYDGPIYAGQSQQPLDQVIADVQTSLQEQGFYKGEVDGLMGPLTRAALAEYQQSQGLQVTSAMDEPTLESLGMS